MHLHCTKLTKRIHLVNKCLQLLSIRLVYTQKSFTSLANIPKKAWVLQNSVFSQTFYPNFQKLLHGYIRHIRDILQLWGDRVQSSNSFECLLNRSFWGKFQPGFWSIASCTPSACAECHNLSDLLLKVYPEWISLCRFNARASELKRNNYQLNTQLKTIDATK